jgi:hypothetical protein
MNLTLDTSRYLVQPVARKSAQVGAVPTPGETTQHQVAPASPPVSPTLEVSVDIESRARQLRQHYFPGDPVSSRSQQAIRSYSTVTELEERSRVSALLGLDEYA